MFVIGSSRSSNTNTGYNVGKNPNKTIADPIKSMFDMLLKIKQVSNKSHIMSRLGQSLSCGTYLRAL